MHREANSRSRSFLLETLAIAGFGMALSVVAYTYTRPDFLRFDENYYFPLAKSIADGIYTDGYIIRPPLYPLFLAAIVRVFGTGFGPALLAQSILRGLIIGGISLLGKRYVSARAGLAAAFLLAICPFFVWTYTRFVSEILFVPLFLISFVFLENAVRSERPRDMAVAGVFSGIATLARSTSLFFTLLIGMWLVIRKSESGRFSGRNMAGAGALVVMLFAVISPWTIRNAVVHKAFIPVDNAAAFNLYLITSGKQIQEASTEWQSWGDHGQRQREGYSRWRAYLKSDPLFHLRRMGTVLPRLFNPLQQPTANSLSVITRHGSVRHSHALRALLGILVPVVFWLITAGGLAGIVAVEHDGRRRTLLLITVAYFIVLHAMTLARPRFLLPMNVLLAIYAGALIDRGLSRLGWTRRSHPEQS